MEILSIQEFSFRYPETKQKALTNIDFQIQKGEFVVICGQSGSGKSTLLKNIKNEIAPHGQQSGTILYKNKELTSYSAAVKAQDFGFIFQNPEHQLVMDRVEDELIFGLENLGYSTFEIRQKIAETVHFFGLHHLIDKRIEELSGGEKQLVSLATVLAMGPEILLLDEPTSQLDPISAKRLLTILEEINKEFGTTILIVEQNLDGLFELADKVLYLAGGELKFFGEPEASLDHFESSVAGRQLLPKTVQFFLNHKQKTASKEIPFSVKDAKRWVSKHEVTETTLSNSKKTSGQKVLELKEVDFQYHLTSPLVLNNLSFSAYQQEIHAVLGANGSGKTTLLKIITQLFKHQHGKIYYHGKRAKKINLKNIGYLPQNPSAFFMYETLIEEYQAIAKLYKIKDADKKIQTLLKRFALSEYQHSHPFDLSGGQLQKAALIGSLLVQPKILLVDEPTKGLDPHAKKELGCFFEEITATGTTIIMVTHDVEFAAEFANRCSLLFRGQMVTTEETAQFFSKNTYYTTVMHRVTREYANQPLLTLEEVDQAWRLEI